VGLAIHASIHEAVEKQFKAALLAGARQRTR